MSQPFIIAIFLQEARTHSDPQAIVTLIGNKVDLRHLRTVQQDEAEKFAKENNTNYIETSALDSTNIEVRHILEFFPETPSDNLFLPRVFA